jgi:aerobic carbon-monoxide dehydrogenase large subunit
LLEKARTIAAHQLEVAEDDLEFEAGAFRVAGAPEREVSIQDLGTAAWLAHDLPEGIEPLLEASYAYDPTNFTFPFGTHICVVEVEPETGTVEIVRYVAVDDCGTIINPMIVEGQVQGGIVQGLGQALFEGAAYDEVGNLTTSSMTNYLVPGAPEVPDVELDHTVTPSTTNPLGVTDVRMPASPQSVWTAINAAAAGGEGR